MALYARLRRRATAAARTVRMARVVARALRSNGHPVLAQIVPIRRCNLACGYCSEYDKTSAPVPLDVMRARIDRLAALGTSMVDLSGGEPLLHPDADEIIRRIRACGMTAGLLTNGYLLTPERIRRLNGAGLDRLQISIDNVLPDEVSYKSLKVLDRKLEALATYATFDVNINTVLGAGVRDSADALVIARRARALGFGTSVGVVHDASGQIRPLGEEEQRVHAEVSRIGRSFYSHAHDDMFQLDLIAGRAHAWHCGAGARYFYICEHGLVHWCSQQRGTPGIPLDRYTTSDLQRERHTVKSCAPHCTISCVHRVATLDALREKPLETLQRLSSPSDGGRAPATVRALQWMFVTGPQHQRFRRWASRAFGLGR